jgi:hypothetical protein
MSENNDSNTPKKYYTVDELKLRGGKIASEYAVQLPKGMQMPYLTKTEQENLIKTLSSRILIQNLRIWKS